MFFYSMQYVLSPAQYRQMIQPPMDAQVKAFPRKKPAWNDCMVEPQAAATTIGIIQQLRTSAINHYMTFGSHATTVLLLGRGTGIFPDKHSKLHDALLN